MHHAPEALASGAWSFENTEGCDQRWPQPVTNVGAAVGFLSQYIRVVKLSEPPICVKADATRSAFVDFSVSEYQVDLLNPILGNLEKVPTVECGAGMSSHIDGPLEPPAHRI